MYVIVLIISFQIAGGVKNSIYHYTHGSFLANGNICLGDCNHGQCAYNWKGSLGSCHMSEATAPVYKTLSGKNCYSNCGRFNDESYTWCATLEGTSIKWDYCSKYQSTTATKQIQTDNYLYTCKDECGKRGKSYNWCYTYNSWEKCDPENWVLVFNYPTEEYNDECITPCVLYKSEYKCYDRKKDWVKCYLNPNKTEILNDFGQAINKALQKYGALFDEGYGICSDSRRKRAINARWPWIYDVRDLVAELESGFPTIVPHDGSPVQSYTVLPVANPGSVDTIVPLAIRAVITRNHLRPANTRQNPPSTVTRNIARLNPYTNRLDGNNDERGHLLASVLGGPSEPYNYIPQPRSFNRGQGSRWYFLEGLIARFLRNQPGRYVEWQMALSYDIYSDRPFRPVSISLNVRMYEADGTLNTTSGDFENMYFSNDPLWTCRTFYTGDGRAIIPN